MGCPAGTLDGAVGRPLRSLCDRRHALAGRASGASTWWWHGAQDGAATWPLGLRALFRRGGWPESAGFVARPVLWSSLR